MHRVQNDIKYDLEDGTLLVTFICMPYLNTCISEDDFAAMKAAAYALEPFDVYISYQKRKPDSRKPVTSVTSRRVSIILPDEEAADEEITDEEATDEEVATVQRSTQKSTRPTKKEPVEANPPPPKKRRISVSAGNSVPADTSILKRKSISDSNGDPSRQIGTEEPPKKKPKVVKSVKEKENKEDPPKDVSTKQPSSKRKSEKSQKADHPTESSESSESMKEISKAKSVSSQKTTKAPPSKKSRSKQDGKNHLLQMIWYLIKISSSTEDDAVTSSKPISKIAKPVKATKPCKFLSFATVTCL